MGVIAGFMHFLSTIITLLAVSYFGILSMKKVQTSQDFSVGSRKLNRYQISGSILGTVVGGASTIGTAQLAFQRGFNAMWFTLGSAAACLLLGFLIAGPLQRAQVDTIPEFLSQSYGEKAGFAASIITSFAIFIHVIGQILSSTAIFTSMFHVSTAIALLVTIGFILSYIFYGGFLGTSRIGIIKTFLLYFALIMSGMAVYLHFNGVEGMLHAFPDRQWFNLFSGGIFAGAAQGFSMVIGIVSTQTYLQAMFAGKDEKESQKGAFIAALLIPPVGLLSTVIGMYMRVAHPETIPKQALIVFILKYLHPVVGGVAIAALIISVLGTASGLILGIATMITRDIYSKKINSCADDRQQLAFFRYCILGISVISGCFVWGNADSLILEWGFLSMALRGTTVFIPLLGVIFYKKRISAEGGLKAILVAPILALMWGIYGIKTVDPLYVGVLASIGIMMGYSVKEKKKSFPAS
ncbi:solute:Na+ symporter, SSS family [Geosporobacter subterraneus DSM 17957]|uniref:Solute:Na+ symporter, SSS family n=1 Tax=Geosporobacter subterraneus DSM 17957 TaxID=1121919 RepID=A0A1M6F3K6_9FIRM|nr:solute:Na+ symporter, SSS family [Geosporobacter subterraneus DSM 17957]